MSKVIYRGTSDSHTLAAADLAKAGVEGFKSTTFPRNVAVEVDNEEAAEAITENELFAGEFELSLDDDAEDSEPKKAKKADKQLDNESGTASVGSGSTSGTTTSQESGTTNGASTKGS